MRKGVVQLVSKMKIPFARNFLSVRVFMEIGEKNRYFLAKTRVNRHTFGKFYQIKHFQKRTNVRILPKKVAVDT